MTSLADLKRCPKCMSADVGGPYPEAAQFLTRYECFACGHKFDTPLVISEQPKPGPTGEFPQGKLDEHDEGELKIVIETITREGTEVVRINFGKLVSWIAFPKQQAVQLAVVILQRCGIPVEIKHSIEGQGGT